MTETEEVHLSVLLGRDVLIEAFPALQHPGTNGPTSVPMLWLPFVALAQLLEIDAQATGPGEVEGFLMDEWASYRINAPEGWIDQRRPGDAMPQRRLLSREEAVLTADGLYLSVAQI